MSAPQPDAPPSPALSLIIPAYNSAPTLEQGLSILIPHLKSMGIIYEVIVVDDGSADNGHTRRVAEAAGCRYIAHAANRGKGAAARTGMLAARGRCRLFTDADIPYTLDALGRFFDSLDSGGCDMAVGNRALGESSYFDHIPLRRRLASRLFAAVTRLLLKGHTFDTQCGIKGFRAEAALDLFTAGRVDGFAFDAELFLIALKRGYAIQQLPVSLRTQGASTVSLITDSLLMLRDLLGVAWRDRRGAYETPARPPRP